MVATPLASFTVAPVALADSMHLPLVAAAMRLASGLHVEDDVEVEITEDDLNDPSLLAELEDLDEDKPRSGETLASLQSKLTAETQKCLSLKRAGRTEEVGRPRHVMRPNRWHRLPGTLAIY